MIGKKFEHSEFTLIFSQELDRSNPLSPHYDVYARGLDYKIYRRGLNVQTLRGEPTEVDLQHLEELTLDYPAFYKMIIEVLTPLIEQKALQAEIALGKKTVVCKI